MATIPIRNVPGDPVQPSGDELILIDNGIAMQKATINDAVEPKATEIADQKIADLNLGTAAQANVEDFATAAQGDLADSAVQPTREIIAGTGLTGGGDLSADRTISLDASSIASLAKADTAVQSVVAGANVTVDATDPRNPIISASGGGGAASTDFATVADLLADDNDKIGYAGSGADTEVLPGDIITAQGFRYEVAASDATDEHVETAGGVLLYYRSNGKWRFEAFGADPSGETPAGEEVLKAIQVAALNTERITFDATGAIFDLTGTHIKSVADGAKICVEGGKFIREDNPSLSTPLFHFAQYAEVIFLNPEFDMGYRGSTNIEEYIDGAQCVACFGCDYFYVTGAKGGHTRGDFLYTSRDTAANGGGTNRNTGTVIWVNNTPHNCKRNYFAVTDAMFYNVSDNICTSDGDDGNGNDYLWARSAVIDFEPNNALDALGYGVCNNNVLRVKGSKNPIRWAVGAEKIPHTYKAIECTGNTIDCTGVLNLIVIEARGTLELLNLDDNKSTRNSAANTRGIFVIGFTGKGSCDGNVVFCRSGATEGIYFSTSSYSTSATQADVSITGGSVEMLDSGADFRGVRANGGVGAMFRVNGVSCVAVNSTNQAVQLFGMSSENKLSQAVVTGCSGRFFSGGINVQNASKALATGNTAGTVSGSGNTVEEFSANL